MAVGRELRVHVDGQIVSNNTSLILDAALAGFGLAYVPEDQVRAHLADGRLVRVLADWCPPSSGHHLYYPSRRQQTPAFALLVDALRYSGWRSTFSPDREPPVNREPSGRPLISGSLLRADSPDPAESGRAAFDG